MKSTLSFWYRKREFPVFSVAFFTQRTAFFFDTNVKCVWILAPDSSLHAFAVSHASNRPRLGRWLPASKGPQKDGELPPLCGSGGASPSRRWEGKLTFSSQGCIKREATFRLRPRSRGSWRQKEAINPVPTIIWELSRTFLVENY